MQTLQVKSKKKEQVPVAKRTLAAYCGRAFIVAIALFALLNMLVARKEAKRDPAEILLQAKQEQSAGIVSRHSWSWWLSKFYEEQAQAPDVVVFGSSLLGSAHASMDAEFLQQLIDALTHRRMVYLEDRLAHRLGYKVSIFSLGSPGEMISDYYAISKALIVSAKKPKLVIATIAPRDFIDSTLAYPGATDHYKFFSNYANLNNVANLAYPDFFSRLAAEMDRLPLKRLGKQAFTANAENDKTDWNQCESCRIEPGKALIPAQAIPKPVDNTKEYVERYRHPFAANYFSEMQFFRLWLADMKKQGIAVFVIGMPTTTGNRHLLPEAFWQRFRSDIAGSCKSSNADWLDLSESEIFKPDDYLDTVHLNTCGAYHLFPVIAEHISINPRSSNALKPAATLASDPKKSSAH